VAVVGIKCVDVAGDTGLIAAGMPTYTSPFAAIGAIGIETPGPCTSRT
jgi:hypothetical protein